MVGEIPQDMDLFRMPVELKIDTDGKTEAKRIEVQGTNSAYAVETFGKPRRISIDPNNKVLQNSQELQVRTSIMRGQQDVEQGDLTEALKEFQKALDINRTARWRTTASPRCSSCSTTTSRRRMPIASR